MKKLLLILLCLPLMAFGQTNTYNILDQSTASYSSLTVTGQASLGGSVGSEGLRVVNTANAVNWVQVAGSVTTGTAVISVQGTDSNRALNITSGGTGAIRLATNNGAQNSFVVVPVGLTDVNRIQVNSNAAGTGPGISSTGSDTNIDINVTPKGTGILKENGPFSVSGAVTLPGLASSSAATTGTLCWTTGTGNVNVDTTLACLASTIKVKQDIKPLNIGLNELMKMRPVSYDLKPEFNPEHLGRQVGLIAEEVAKIDDRLIAKDDKGDPRGVRYMQMTAVIIKAMQEQQAMIKVLRHDLKILRVRLSTQNK